MSARTRKIKLELSVSEAVALYYAAGSLRAEALVVKMFETEDPDEPKDDKPVMVGI
jgi:hypothetical protein